MQSLHSCFPRAATGADRQIDKFNVVLLFFLLFYKTLVFCHFTVCIIAFKLDSMPTVSLII